MPFALRLSLVPTRTRYRRFCNSGSFKPNAALLASQFSHYAIPLRIQGESAGRVGSWEKISSGVLFGTFQFHGHRASKLSHRACPAVNKYLVATLIEYPGPLIV